MDEDGRAMLRGERVGFVFQSFHLVSSLTAIENVMLPAAPLGEPFRTVRARAAARLDALGLADKADMKVEYLSGGETQRVAIARALVNDASVFIADEPTANLDTALADRFLDIVADIITSRAADIDYVDMRYSNGFTIGWTNGSNTPISDPESNAENMLALRGRP